MRLILSAMAARGHRWRERLAAEIQASGKSMREISMAAKLGEGYVHSIMRTDREPSVGNLLRIAEVLGAPVVSLFEEGGRAEARSRLQRIADRLTPEQLRMLESVAAALAEGDRQDGKATQSDMRAAE
jgi:transcriptional regulator with XRE-family HTH domain